VLLVPSVAVVTKRELLEEFKILAQEAGYDIKDTLYVKRLLSRGLSEYKIRELKKKMLSTGAKEVLFDTSLKPRQTYNIAKEIKVAPKDRIEIILEIFRLHAPSKEAELQIKLASLNYELMRAKEKVRLAKRGEQPGFYGLGAYEVDVYYDEIKKRMTSLKRKLNAIRKKRELHRHYRKKRGYKTIVITGYTCSGKTSLFNTITGLLEKTGPEPFTTLSTKFSVLKVGPWKCYISDTIGFIRDLPPFVITAFYSTLEEISFADLVLLVIDASENIDVIDQKMKTSLDILRALEYVEKPILIVANKIDLIDKYRLKDVISVLVEYEYPVIPVSALYRINIDRLIKVVESLLGRVIGVRIELPYNELMNKNNLYGSVVSKIKELGIINKIEYLGENIYLDVVVDRKTVYPLYKYIHRLGGRVRVASDMDIASLT